jgi:hypothetical protein
LEDILFKVIVVTLVLAFLGAIAYDDRRTRKMREEKDRAAKEADRREPVDGDRP